jgi:transcriptional regulator with XRE-family HTH domain
VPGTPLSDWLRKQIRRRQWSQSDLARELGVGTGTISRWMNGRQPDTRYCERIADVFGVEADLVLTLAGHRPEVEPIDPDDPVERICGLLRRARLTLEQFDAVEGMVDRYRGWNRKMAREAKGR